MDLLYAISIVCVCVNNGVYARDFTGVFSSKISTHAQQIVLDLKTDLELNGFKGPPMPLYRKDLPAEYVAYWELVFSDQYIIVSAGPQTGDHNLVQNGPLPSPTVHLREKARSTHAATCEKFFLLSPGGQAMCEDEDGHVTATNIPGYMFGYKRRESDDNLPIKVMTGVIRSKLDILKKDWQSHAKSIASNRISNVPKSGSHRRDSEMFEVASIRPGFPVHIVIPDPLKEARIHLLQMEFNGNKLGSKNEKLLCEEMVLHCVSTNESGVISKEAMHVDEDTGIHYLQLELLPNVYKSFRGKQLVFRLEIIHKSTADDVIRYFGVVQSKHRKKRSVESADWSSYQETSIPMEDKFPNYDQFHQNDCPIGCGPVAWAMVFGYLDRRSHANSTQFPGGENLYRNGENGMDGNSSEVAPSTNDARIDGYLTKFNEILGTFCILEMGATLMWDMTSVSGFYQERQGYGTPAIVEDSHLLGMSGVYSEDVEAWTRAKINEGWPVIIGWRTSSSSFWVVSSWHYPVVTRFRQRTRDYRVCWWSSCSAWRSETEYDMYLHQGWGGYGDGWKKMEAFYAITAVY